MIIAQKEFPKIYLSKVKGYSEAFKRDIFDTCLRIYRKDGKAYGLRIHRSVSKRYKCQRNVVSVTLLWFEHVGILSSRLETLEEFRSRMVHIPGLYHRGRRRKYYGPAEGIPSDRLGRDFQNAYTKLTFDELGIPYTQTLEYPV